MGTAGTFLGAAQAAGVFELTVGIGIIGAGMVGQMCHLANYVANPACRVVALADLRPELATAAATKFGIAKVYRTHLEMLADSEITAVVVVTRRRATGPIVLDALTSGRHVLSEKPMAYTTAQATRLVEVARRKNLIYSVGYMKRHDAGVARAKELLAKKRADGSLGKIVSARAWCFAGETGGARDTFAMTGEPRPEGISLWPDGPDWMPAELRPGYDTFVNIYCHIINLTRYLLGPRPTLVESHLPAGAAANVTLDFDGVACSLELANQSAGAWREGIVVTFERGYLTIELPPPFAVGAEARVMVDDGRQKDELRRGDSWAFQRQADAFALNVASRTAPVASGEDSVADIALSESIWHAHAAI
jgi:predicted dehydrogenase